MHMAAGVCPVATSDAYDTLVIVETVRSENKKREERVILERIHSLFNKVNQVMSF